MKALKGNVVDMFDERIHTDESHVIHRSSTSGNVAVFCIYEGVIKLVDGESTEIVEVEEDQLDSIGATGKHLVMFD